MRIKKSWMIIDKSALDYSVSSNIFSGNHDFILLHKFIEFEVGE